MDNGWYQYDLGGEGVRVLSSIVTVEELMSMCIENHLVLLIVIPHSISLVVVCLLRILITKLCLKRILLISNYFLLLNDVFVIVGFHMLNASSCQCPCTKSKITADSTTYSYCVGV